MHLNLAKMKYIYIVISSVIIITLLLFSACEKSGTGCPCCFQTGKTAGGQVIYTDVMPNDSLTVDTASSRRSRTIDINKDGIDDLNVVNYGSSSSSSQTSKYYLKPLHDGCEFVRNDNHELIRFEQNDTINANLDWSHGEAILYYYTNAIGLPAIESGTWNDGYAHYAAVRISAGDDINYGWIKMKVETGWTMVVYEFASTFCN